MIYHLHLSGYVTLYSLRYQVGNGSMIRFWKDTWLGDAPLCSRFNRLFRLEKNQNCLVRDRIVDGLWAWDWHRPVNGGRALADFNNLLMDIGSLNVEVDRDCVVSSLSTDGSYSVSFIQKHIDNYMIANSLPSTRWCKIIHQKVNIFMWRLLLDRLPYRLNLSSHGLDIDSILCPVCFEHVESNSHAFFSCSAASNIWRLVRGWCELKIPTLYSCDEWDIWYTSWNASKVEKDRAYVIFATTC
ncbi:RNA-directed DNA polymerase, eukaryota [Tanacetum coccineum]